MFNNEKDLPKQFIRAPRLVEPIGVIPRSIFRAVGRLIQQLFRIKHSADVVVAQYKFSRYQVFVSIKFFLTIIFVPIIAQSLSVKFILTPATSYLWNSQQEDIFLNPSLEERALQDIQDYQDELFFDYFLTPSKYETPIWALYQIEANKSMEFSPILKSRMDERMVDLARDYNQQSITYLTTICGDMVTVYTIGFILLKYKAEMIIFKSFVLELFYGFHDSTKSILLIFSTNLLVGFHSSRGWELFIDVSLSRLGYPPSEPFMLLFVATFPVVLDTVFKYWIFRYLNRTSPTTVATYHSMLE